MRFKKTVVNGPSLAEAWQTFWEFADEEEPDLESARCFRMDNGYHQPEKQVRFCSDNAWQSGTAAFIVEADPDMPVARTKPLQSPEPRMHEVDYQEIASPFTPLVIKGDGIRGCCMSQCAPQRNGERFRGDRRLTLTPRRVWNAKSSANEQQEGVQ